MATKTSKLSTNNLIALSALVCLAMVVVLFLVGRVMLKQITHNSAVIGKKQKAESQLKLNIAALPGLTQNYQNLGANKDLIAIALPTTSNFPELVATLESIANASNVTLSSVAPQGEPEATGSATASSPAAASTLTGVAATNTGPQSFPFSISVAGSYATLNSFISNIQLSVRPITISGVQFTGTTDKLTGSISAQTYFYDPHVLEDKTETVK